MIEEKNDSAEGKIIDFQKYKSTKELVKVPKKENKKVAPYKEKLDRLYEKNYDDLFSEKFDPQNIESLTYLEKMVILEKAVRKEIIGLDEIINAFQKTLNNGLKLALIETMLKIKYKTTQEKTKALDFLRDIALTFQNETDYSIDFSKETDTADYYYISKFKIGAEITDDEEIIIPAAILEIGKAGADGDKYLLELFQKLDQDPELDFDQEIDSDNSTEEDDFIGELTDDRGDLVSPEDKYSFDAYYFEKGLAIKLLAENKSQEGIDFFIDYLKTIEDSTFIYRREITELIQSDKIYSSDKIVKMLSQENLSNEQIFRFITILTDISSDIEARDRIDQEIVLAKIKEDGKKLENLERVRSFISPNSNKEAILNLQNFYENYIRFEEYKVNEKMNAKEVALLKSLISKDDKVLEMGCGTGRLIKELVKDGFDMTGFDFTARHTEIAKAEIEKTGKTANIFQGDWHNNALKDESFDKVYSLGRNILHDYSIIDQVKLFREAARILRQGGEFIFDIPNRDKGSYKKMVDGYADEMKNRGIQNFRLGSIYDSPDGEHFATRYAYSKEDIEELAALSGMRIKEIKKEKLETGDGDENLYFVLEKIQPEN